MHLPVEKLSTNTVAETTTTATELNGLMMNSAPRETSLGESIKAYKAELWKRYGQILLLKTLKTIFCSAYEQGRESITKPGDKL